LLGGILSSKLLVQDSAKIAILDFTNFTKKNNKSYDYDYWIDEDNLKIQQGYIDTITSSLSKSGNVEKVMLIPSMLINKETSITELREVSVRLQADYLFVYSFTSDIYYDYKAFDKDEIKAFATCEAILIDIRTGLIPYSKIITKEVKATKIKTDITNEDFRKRVINIAVTEALKSVSNEIVIYLNN
jgi:hypothetical protein